ncbi:hypothetical protein [Tahibacter caeni]|uniref:hypothetical protein n=1 Tax=Tahibacter caeni TaxID=1453545 RepID=UPI002147E4E5|nr:hypothetical protein [Tahibacter caeni]
MRKIALSLLLASIGFEAQAALVVDPVRLPDLYQFQRTTASVVVVNDGTKAVTIRQVRPLRSGDRVISFPTSIAPAASASIDVEIDAANDYGSAVHSFHIDTADSADAVIARVALFAQSVLENGRTVVEFGAVKAAEVGKAQAVFELRSDDIPDLAIEQVLEAPPFARADLQPDKRSVRLTLDKVDYYGMHRANLKLKLNSTLQTQAWGEIVADVRGDVVPSANPFPLELVLANKPNEYIVVLRHEGQGKFSVGKPSFERIKGKAAVEPCAGKAADCKQVRFSIDKDNTPGRLNGTLIVPLGDKQPPLKIDLYGLMLKDDSNVVKVDGDKLMAQAAESAGEDGKVEQPFMAQFKQAIDTRDKTVNQPVPPGTGPLLRWQATPHNGVHGYAIYRARAAQGPFERLTRDVIAQVEPEEGGSVNYAWRDDTAVKGTQYWYYVGAVMTNGSKKKISEPMAVTAK